MNRIAMDGIREIGLPGPEMTFDEAVVSDKD